MNNDILTAEKYARAVSEHIEDCNWARACELQYEYNLKNPPESSVPDWRWMLLLMVLLSSTGEKKK